MKLFNANNMEALKELQDNSIDSIVTDPPYGLSFMNKHWDYDVPQTELWKECLRVLKPGGHLLAFFGTRTYHRGVVRIEDAGFEIRDQIMWIYGSGFPKSHDVSKAIDKAAGAERTEYTIDEDFLRRNPGNKTDGVDRKKEYSGTEFKEGLDAAKRFAPATPDAQRWQGWGTALKPANEPIVVARKPLEKGLTIAENVVKCGTGALNIDECRIDLQPGETTRGSGANQGGSIYSGEGSGFKAVRKGVPNIKSTQGRWPANILFDEQAAMMLDEQTGELGKSKGGNSGSISNSVYGKFNTEKNNKGTGFGDSGGASRFFYVAKASKSERNKGLDSFEQIVIDNECKEENTAAAQLLQKVILESMVKWSTGESGKSITALFPKECKSTIKTEINKIIESKILNVLMRSLTSENTQDVLMDLSLVESVENLKKFLLTITSEKMELALGAVNVALKMLSSIKENENSKDFNNFHSTVKPIKLMEYLIKLVTPPKGTVLDPFMGSGSTGVAAKKLGFDFVGIELSAEYFEIAEKRIQNEN